MFTNGTAASFLLEPDGTVTGWNASSLGPLGGTFGLGTNDRMEPNTAYAVPGLRNVATMAVGS